MSHGPVLGRLLTLLILTTGGALVPEPGHAQEGVLRSRLDAVLTAAPDTPAGAGLLPTALAEAWTALQEARRAQQAPGDLAAMQRHARGVRHAVEPVAGVGDGPGLGYGVRRAVEAIRAQIEGMPQAARGADVAALAPEALAAANSVLAWAAAVVEASQHVERATTAAEARAHVADLQRLTHRLTFGAEREAGARLAVTPGGTGLLVMRTTLQALQGHQSARAEVRP